MQPGGKSVLDKILSKFKIKEDLTSLNHKPSKGELIYHYCNSIAFWSICTNRSMWLSSIFNMNDTKELIWGRDLLLDTLKNNKRLFPQEFRMLMIFNIYSVDGDLLPLIASFSKNGDLLSQWRAYADDAKGFSIGFCKNTISNTLPVNMKNISYNRKEQEELIFNSLIVFHKWWEKLKDENLSIMTDPLLSFSMDLASLKNPSFYEEQEVRVIHLLTKNRDNNTWFDAGGHNVKEEIIPGLPVLSRVSINKDIPYIDMPLIDQNSIQKVILGSKNPESIDSVREKLNSLGLGHVLVEKSLSTYQ